MRLAFMTLWWIWLRLMWKGGYAISEGTIARIE